MLASDAGQLFNQDLLHPVRLRLEEICLMNCI